MAKKLTIDYDFDEDYYAIEVLSPLMDYEFAWMINKAMKMNFRRSEHFRVFEEQETSTSEYALFTWKRLERVTYFLSHPCNTSNMLMPVYYFFIQCPEQEVVVNSFFETLQNLPDVVSAEFIHIGSIDDLPEKKQTPAFKRLIFKICNILYDLEEHLRVMKLEEKERTSIMKNNLS